MKLSLSLLPFVLMGSAVEAQVGCVNRNWPQGSREVSRTKFTTVLNTFWIATFAGGIGSATLQIDPRGHPLILENRSGQRQVICLQAGSALCFWLNAGGSCVATMSTTFPDDPKFIDAVVFNL